jgi:predicted ATPase
MIIELQNFGPIKSFKFDTSKDMHAIFGKNNIGKSYAISAVYLILKNLREQVDIMEKQKQDITGPAMGPVTLVHKKGEVYEYKNDAQGESDYLIRTLIANLNKSFANTFDTSILKNIYSGNLRPAIKIYIDDFKMDLSLHKNQLNEQIIGITTIQFGSHITIDKTGKPYQINLFGKDNLLLEKMDSTFSDYPILDIFVLRLQYFKNIFKKELSDIYYLPASRSGLYNTLNSFGAIFAELSRNRNFIHNKFEIPSISEPISDYFLNLNTINKAQVNEHYLTHFEEIEQEILKGKITLDNETKKYYYVPTDTDMRLELSFTSSMISEIAPIIAHLKYIIPLESDKPSILFIEEPEAHLHPEIQILLIEYFVKLSKGNVKIVMTSHSNYIFNKLSNLLIANKIDKEKLSVSLMKMTPEGSVIEDGAMQMDEYGIEDNNFVDVAEQLYEERMSLLEKL